MDDVFIPKHSYAVINKTKQTLENNSVLNFINELNINEKSLSLIYLQTPTIITNSQHLLLISLPASNSTLLNYYIECSQ